MKTVTVTIEQFAAAVHRYGVQYARDLQPALISETADTMTFDMEHPAWIAAMAKYPKPQAAPILCPRCNAPMTCGCKGSCRSCGFSEGCGG